MAKNDMQHELARIDQFMEEAGRDLAVFADKCLRRRGEVHAREEGAVRAGSGAVQPRRAGREGPAGVAEMVHQRFHGYVRTSFVVLLV